MRTMLGAVLAGLLLVSATTSAQAQESKRFRIGQIIIVGNEVTPDYLIRSPLMIYPGQLASMADLRRAETRLRRLWYVLPQARVTVLEMDANSEYRDILVQVQERIHNRLLMLGCEALRFRYTGDLDALDFVVRSLRSWCQKD